MSSRIPRGRAGRKGQQHRAKPGDLRSYEVTPASEVTITRADGTVEQQPAKKARTVAAPSRRPKRRGPAVCAMCGDRITDAVVVSREVGPVRGKPVHGSCEDKARAFTQARRAEKAKAKAEKVAAEGPKLSLAEENRRLLARQDLIRQRQGQSKAARSGKTGRNS
ncbi:hypothetical protein [Streptomyces chryseus]|uniref:hypothetical protein n=1 Tax=Streptomyces chryseus TaxID=68186 RepID=UPI00110F76BF|nr:hypothetical protein [Streptomyces chryseus]GGX36753.1 hypothetical protein GCM10010353_59910 [Streptomyces chryseus]